jgi:hypothetical protein
MKQWENRKPHTSFVLNYKEKSLCIDISRNVSITCVIHVALAPNETFTEENI